VIGLGCAVRLTSQIDAATSAPPPSWDHVTCSFSTSHPDSTPNTGVMNM